MLNGIVGFDALPASEIRGPSGPSELAESASSW
jgi:hypothetical protein